MRASDPEDFLAILSPVQRPDADARAAALFEQLCAADTEREALLEMPGLRLCARAKAGRRRHLIDKSNAVVIGDLFESNLRYRAPAQIEVATGAGGREICKILTTRYWGRYVAIGVDVASGRPWLMRDPTGALPLYLWSIGPIVIASTTLPSDLLELTGVVPDIDWNMIATLIMDPIRTAIITPLVDVRLAVPGVLMRWPGASETVKGGFDEEIIWSPAQMAKTIKPLDPARLSSIVRDCIALWAGDHDCLAVELSGGLDSAIVLGALSTLSAPPLAHGLNINFTGAGDEQRYARAAAAKWGAPLVEAVVEPSELDYLEALGGPRHVRPLVYGMDVLADRISCEAAASSGAGLILSGQGGDAVFLQPGTAAIAADYWQAQGLDGRFLKLVHDAALRLNCSIWSLLRDIVWPRPEPPSDESSILRRIAGPTLRPWLGTSHVHPWQTEALGLSRGRRLQVELLVNCQIYHSPTRTAQRFHLCHPLLSQPIVEACLAMPVWTLSPDHRDRGLARDIFAPLLPDLIRFRQSKGNTSTFYNRAVSEHLSSLRPFLLEGQLVARGLIDAEALGELMDPQVLLVREVSGIIARLTTLEIWLACWSS